MATGMAKGAKGRGKQIAFGDGYRIRWDKSSLAIFQNNPNIAMPGSERKKNLEWIHYYKGCRIYNKHDAAKTRWVWNMDFRPIQGELYFTKYETDRAKSYGGKGMIVIEPNVEAWKSVADNKRWPFERYQEVANALKKMGHDVVQFSYPKTEKILDGVRAVVTPTFRSALAHLSFAKMYIGTEGGLHHGAAALGIKGVVLFGAFIPPQVTGYSFHRNLTGNATEFCGSLTPCQHCKEAMDSIRVDEVLSAAEDQLKNKAA